MRALVIASAMCLSTLGIALATDVRAAMRMPTNIQAQGLGTALQALAKAREFQIVYRPEYVRDRTTGGAAGELTRDEALARILADTGLTFRYLNENTVTIEPVGVNRNAGSAPTQSSEPAGALERSSSLWSRLRLAQSDTPSASQVDAQKAPSKGEGQSEDERPAQRQKLIELEEVIVTGSRIRGAQPAGSELLTFSRDDIAETGAATIDEFARQIPQNFASLDATGALSSNSGGFSQTGSNSYGGAGFNLRGLGPGATLTLLDGHRVAPAGTAGAFVDTSLIPLAAVSRIEVLPDGASAIYGADAVAGVVNIILRKDFDGAETSARYGTTTAGGGGERTVSQVFGKGWDSGNAMLVYQFDGQNELRLNQRDYLPAQTHYAILPERKINSFLFDGQQTLTDATSLSGTAYYSDRKTNSANAINATQLSTVQDRAKQYGGTLGVEQKLAGTWQMKLDGGLSKLEQSSVAVLTAANATPTTTIVPVATRLGSMELLADGSLFALPAGDAKAAVGGEYRDEELNSSQLTFTTSPGQPTVQSLSRKSYSVFAEFLVPIWHAASTGQGARRLDLSIAGRYDHYNDFGRSTNPKVGLEWVAAQGLTLRATYSTSFNPPLLTQIVDAPLYAVYPLPNAASPKHATDTLWYLTTTHPGLRPETAKSFAAGFDFLPERVPDLKISGTYFHTDYTDRISVPPYGGNIFTVWSQAGALAPFIDTSPSLAELQAIFASGNVVTNPLKLGAADVQAIFDSRYQNIAESVQSGVDATISYQHSSSLGKFGLSLSGEYVFAASYRVASTIPAITFDNKVGEPVRMRLHSLASWSNGGLGSSLIINYWGRYENPFLQPQQSVSSWMTVDLQTRYRIGDQTSMVWLKDISVALTVQNLFDRRPPAVTYPTGSVQYGFDPANATAVGRFVSLQLTKGW